MIFFIVGIMMGLGIGWRLCQRAYDKRLTQSTAQLRQATEALGKSNTQNLVLTASLNAANTLLKQPKNSTEHFAA